MYIEEKKLQAEGNKKENSQGDWNHLQFDDMVGETGELYIPSLNLLNKVKIIYVRDSWLYNTSSDKLNKYMSLFSEITQNIEEFDFPRCDVAKQIFILLKVNQKFKNLAGPTGAMQVSLEKLFL